MPTTTSRERHVSKRFRGAMISTRREGCFRLGLCSNRRGLRQLTVKVKRGQFKQILEGVRGQEGDLEGLINRGL